MLLYGQEFTQNVISESRHSIVIILTLHYILLYRLVIETRTHAVRPRPRPETARTRPRRDQNKLESWDRDQKPVQFIGCESETNRHALLSITYL